MDTPRSRARTAGSIGVFGVLLASVGAGMVLVAAWAAPMASGDELGLAGRIGFRVATILRQAWYVLAFPAGGLLAIALALMPFGHRAPAGCGYAVAGTGLLVLAVSIGFAGLALFAR